MAFGKAPSADKVLEIAEDWEIKRGQQILSWGTPKSTAASTLAASGTPVALGGVTVTLLWENPKPASAFDAQDLNLTGAERRFYIVLTKSAADDDTAQTFLCQNSTGMVHRINCSWVDTDTVINSRSMTVLSADQIHFSQNEFMSHTGSSGVNNDWNIPWRIYGVNF